MNNKSDPRGCSESRAHRRRKPAFNGESFNIFIGKKTTFTAKGADCGRYAFTFRALCARIKQKLPIYKLGHRPRHIRLYTRSQKTQIARLQGRKNRGKRERIDRRVESDDPARICVSTLFNPAIFVLGSRLHIQDGCSSRTSSSRKIFRACVHELSHDGNRYRRSTTYERNRAARDVTAMFIQIRRPHLYRSTVSTAPSLFLRAVQVGAINELEKNANKTTIKKTNHTELPRRATCDANPRRLIPKRDISLTLT